MDGDTRPAIARVWRGRTAPERADEYERYNDEEGIRPLHEKAMGVLTFREDGEEWSEFATIPFWASEEAMSALSGGDPRAIQHLPRDEEFLLELPTEVQVLRLRSSHGRTG